MEYTKLEYIESIGTQYIDLGFKLSSNHAVDLDLQMVKLNANIFGSRAGAQDRAFTLFGNGSSILTDMGGTRNSTTATTDRINVYLSSSKIKIGTFEKNISSGSFTTPGNGYIFNISYSRPQSYMASMKLYGCKIYLSGTLIRDFIPCKYNNKIGLWDTINGSFLGNAGTGEFVAGPKVGPKTLKVKTVDKNNLYKKLEYLQSTGTQYIDTGVKFTAGFSCDIKFNMLSTSGDIDILSSSRNDNYLLVSYLNGTPRIYLNGASRNITMPYNTVHTVNMNYNGSTLTYTVDNTTTYTVSKSNATANSNLLLFARSSSYGFSKAVLYYCKIWNGDTLVKDLIPVEKASDNTICLYDLISNTFLENSGTGEFAAGPYSLIGKTVSKINGKYAKTINGVSVQCWKKKYE